MTLAFALYKYFPFGGLQRDFLRIALECQKRGHNILVFTTSWQGDQPDGFDIRFLEVSGNSNHVRMLNFQQQISSTLKNQPKVALVGFNKLPGLDIYYAADTCYLDKAQSKGWLYRLTSRFRYYKAFEEAVFSQQSHTVSLLISALQKPVFQQYYHTPDERIHLLPPGISRDRCRPDNAEAIRMDFRKEFGLTNEDKLILMVGSGFRTKGLDRAIKAVASLPSSLKQKTRFFVIGQDKQKPFASLARQAGIQNQLHFFAGRDDVPRFLLGADLLIHPAYNENTGTVLLEALVAGLPVLTTDVCGYAHYINDANSGTVVQSPFAQEALNQSLSTMLTSKTWQAWQNNAIAFSHQEDLYSMPERATDIIIEQAQQKSDHASFL
ncbi:glycosyltransferase family 4 protein [Endozoicomonas numazuensis]|uniref:Glucosyltransferase I RfaG n=1 Tax=Endozoicomonas numazuensis TaxID=1137799 RepID=A0A081NIL6_9GAMM|nr:glycosyltransferase family 4 protein [Endozoicomonas numazuensis]KEQ18289.1 glucosyltransferase I RfaG [Endozoicomonas numazuensis]